MKNKVRIYSILRVLLMLLVVIGHSSYLVVTTKLGGVHYTLTNKSPIIIAMSKIETWIFEFHMPLFFMLSGAVYHLSEKNNLDELVRKKFNRLIIPFFIYGIFFMLPIKRIAGFYTNSDFSEVIKSFLSGGENGHLWFLPALFWVSVVFFLILKIFKNRSIFAVLVVSFLIQTYHAKYIPIDMFLFQRGMGYIFWYALGYCFEIFRQKTKFFEKKKNVILLFLLSLFVIIINNKYNILDQYFVVIFNSCMCYSLASIILLTKTGKMKIWDIMEKYSMDIYLFHDPLEYVVLMFAFQYNNIFTSLIGNIVYVMARTGGVVIISMILAVIVNKVKTFVVQKNIYLGEKAKY